MKATMEVKLYALIKESYEEIKEMYPKDGFSSPRDLKLAREINKKTTIMDKLQEGMRIINPLFSKVTHNIIKQPAKIRLTTNAFVDVI